MMLNLLASAFCLFAGLYKFDYGFLSFLCLAFSLLNFGIFLGKKEGV